jgi:hypothetical protein
LNFTFLNAGIFFLEGCYSLDLKCLPKSHVL